MALEVLHLFASDTPPSFELFPTFVGWQFVLVAATLVSTFLFNTIGMSMGSAFFGGSRDPRRPYEEDQNFVDITSAFTSLVVSFSAAIIMGNPNDALALTVGLMIMLQMAIAVVVETKQRKREWKEIAQEHSTQEVTPTS